MNFVLTFKPILDTISFPPEKQCYYHFFSQKHENNLFSCYKGSNVQQQQQQPQQTATRTQQKEQFKFPTSQQGVDLISM